MLRRRGPWLAAALALVGFGAGSCGGDSDLFSSGPGPTSSGGGTGSGAGGSSTSSGAGGTSASSSGGGSGGASSGAGGEGGSGMGVGAPCTWGGPPCDPDLYCQAEGCGEGTCQPVLDPSAQTPAHAPVCGCDGISYFNPSIAASFGVAVAHGDPCEENEQVACHKDDNPCPDGRFCTRRVATVAGCLLTPNQGGVCWGVPINCDPGGPKANACANSLCYDICSLIQGQNPWYSMGTCF